MSLLLMIEPWDDIPPLEDEALVESGGAVAVAVRQGQFLTVEATSPGPINVYAFLDDIEGEFLSPHHSRVFNGSFQVRIGMRMTTNRRRSYWVIGKDTSGEHDLLLPARAGTSDAVRAALEASGRRVPRIPDPVNLFSGVTLAADGRIASPAEPAAGGSISGRVLIDSMVVVGIPSSAGTGRVRVHNRPQ